MDYGSLVKDLMEYGSPGTYGRPKQIGESASGRPLYPEGNAAYSEKTVTFPLLGKWVTFPSVDSQGKISSENDVRNYVQRNGPVDPITGEQFPTFDTQDEAERYARMRSATRR